MTAQILIQRRFPPGKNTSLREALKRCILKALRCHNNANAENLTAFKTKEMS